MLVEIFERQKLAIQEDESRREQDEDRGLTPKQKKDRSLVIIMDDCLADAKDWKNDTILQHIFLNGRHFQITLIMALQYVNGIPPQMRDNMDYAFILKSESASSTKKVYDAFSVGFDTATQFGKALEKLTQNHSSMVIARCLVVERPLDKIMFYKAKDLSSIKFETGCKKYQLLHQMWIDKNWSLNLLRATKNGDIKTVNTGKR